MKFYKVLNCNLKHHNFQYKLGLNILEDEFNELPICDKGGFYFCDYEHVVHWFELTLRTKWICEVELCFDSKVITVEDGFKYKTNKFILKNKISIRDFVEQYNLVNHVIEICENPWKFLKDNLLTEEILIKLVTQEPDFFDLAMSHIDFNRQTEKICFEAVKTTGFAFKYIDPQFQTPEICMMAIKDNPYMLKYVINQTPELCKISLNGGGSLLDIKEQTVELCICAVEKSWFALEDVKNQTFEICSAAVENNIFALALIKNPKLKEQCKSILSQDQITKFENSIWNKCISYKKLQFE